MRAYYRTGRRSGVSFGPIGLLVALPFIIMWYMIVALVVAVIAIAAIVDELVIKPLRRRSAQHA